MIIYDILYVDNARVIYVFLEAQPLQGILSVANQLISVDDLLFQLFDLSFLDLLLDFSSLKLGLFVHVLDNLDVFSHHKVKHLKVHLRQAGVLSPLPLHLLSLRN